MSLRAPIRRAAAVAGCAAAVLACGRPLAAQGSAPDLRTEVAAGSEAERYLRLLQAAGAAPVHTWSLHGFSPAEIERMVPAEGDHPWAARLPPPDTAAPPRARLRLVRPRAELVYNSAFPQTANDGAVWAGRGMTAVASAGVQLRAGPLTARVEPLAFWTENRDFALMPNRLPDSLRYQDPISPISIDFPQRFGDGSFARVHPGESYVRLDVRGVAAGISTANQTWGPAQDQPLVLGASAAGFPHAFVGTSVPWNVGLGRLHARIVWGELGQSAYSPMTGHGSRRFMSGLVAAFTPRGLDGLEVGVLRFFHDPWPEDGLGARQFARPLESFWKANLGGRDEPGGPEGVENQLASAFFRWVLPRAGVEVYGEFAREDHNWDLLDAVLEPDRASGYMVGGRKVWHRGARLLSLRTEWVDTQQGHLIQSAYYGLVYRHSNLRQGHTVGGQLLGSLAGYGGGGSVVALEGYTPRGRWSVDWTRTRMAAALARGGPVVPTDQVDVLHSLGGEAVLFRGRFDAVARLRGSLELNRHFAGDAFNLTAGLGVRVGL